MFRSLFSTCVDLLCLVHLTHAHWYLSCIGVSAPCVEGSHQNPYNKDIGSNGLLQTAPIAPADASPDMICGTIGVPMESVSPLLTSPGSTLTAHFLHDTGAPWDRRMNSNHHGFTSVFLSPMSSKGHGNVWTKIYGDGLDTSQTAASTDWDDPANTDECVGGGAEPGCTVGPFVGWWATDKLRMNEGQMPFTIPSSVPSWRYILRAEMLTTYLPNTVSTAQAYVGCASVLVGDEATDDSSRLAAISGQGFALPEAYVGAPWINYHLHEQWINGVSHTFTYVFALLRRSPLRVYQHDSEGCRENLTQLIKQSFEERSA